MAHLATVCPVWARVAPDLGPLPLLRRADGFAALAEAVVGQLISISAAAAITARLTEAGLMTPEAILAAPEDALRATGLSRPKAGYLKAIAAAGVDWDGLRALPDDQVIATLTALPGIGAWTAEIYLKMALGRADAFAAGDLALQEGARLMYGLDARPTASALRRMAEPWRPWRAVAARGLWAYYLRAKGREGLS
ncbi:DNA-3-methyladenine glycosylase family protein [Paracoccus shandongensis]|uniref:DNA-3-methyladenine glycosylase family protein n=1 Tax=Paracoccus shandongensis TaxID=2816048 RepID=UPI001A8EE2C4|nr:DNA-3-methyladenine glycosylase 2 family protein [Paracoccus shandongensis]